MKKGDTVYRVRLQRLVEATVVGRPAPGVLDLRGASGPLFMSRIEEWAETPKGAYTRYRDLLKTSLRRLQANLQERPELANSKKFQQTISKVEASVSWAEQAILEK